MKMTRILIWLFVIALLPELANLLFYFYRGNIAACTPWCVAVLLTISNILLLSIIKKYERR